MIVEITLGVACGIVLAVLVSRYWSLLVRSSPEALGLIIVLVAVVIGGVFLWYQRTSPVLTNVLAILALIATVAMTWRTFELLYLAISRAYPPYGQLFKGEPPCNRGVRAWLRTTLIAAVWLFGAALAASGFFCHFAFLRCRELLETLLDQSSAIHRIWFQQVQTGHPQQYLRQAFSDPASWLRLPTGIDLS